MSFDIYTRKIGRYIEIKYIRGFGNRSINFKI